MISLQTSFLHESIFSQPKRKSTDFHCFHIKAISFVNRFFLDAELWRHPSRLRPVRKANSYFVLIVRARYWSQWTILNESTTFRNQIMCVLFVIYTALHVSAYKQAIFRCYLTSHKSQKGQATEFLLVTCDLSDSTWRWPVYRPKHVVQCKIIKRTHNLVAKGGTFIEYCYITRNRIQNQKIRSQWSYSATAWAKTRNISLKLIQIPASYTWLRRL
jgi:hypothetical protein